MSSRRRRAGLLGAAAVLLLLIGGRMTAEFLEALLWYRSLGMERVFWTRWLAGAGTRILIGGVFAGVVFANLWVVSRTLGTIRVRRRFANLEIAERLPQIYVLSALLLVAGLSGWWLSAGMGNPVSLLAALRPASWELRDPLFGRDASFYVFRLPVLGRIQALTSLLLAWSALLVASAYVATGAIKIGEGRLAVSPTARRHLGVLASAFLVVFAWDQVLDRYALLYAGHGVGGSLGYTDAHARLPAMLGIALLALGAAAAVGIGLWQGRSRLALAGVGALAVGVLVGQIAYPALLQKLVVEPNEFRRERPYIEHHLRFTRFAYQLAEIRSVRLPYRDSVDLSAPAVMHALSAAPLWDPRPLLASFRQKESLYSYYEFNSVYPDRYAGEQVAIAVRELDPAQLPEAARTWQNLHLTYVSGEGAVVSPMASMSEDGSPVYYLRDIAPPKLGPQAPQALELRRPEVFFGEEIRGYVVVDPDALPLGVALSSLWRKLVFAWAFQSKNLLLSGNVTPGSRIVYRRGILERIQALAPFLRLLPERGALPVIHDGRIVWVVDGFTETAHFPLSSARPLGRQPVRYVRNSVKVTVDAVTGMVHFYVLDPQDPILRTYARIFPGLLRPLGEMPPTLREHLRVPAPLLELQAAVLGDYHLRDPARFYAREDVWTAATQRYRDEEQVMEPTYAMLPLPGETEREFVLTVPLVARGRPNLAALLVARNDLPHYGERIVYELPREQLVPGPQQIESQIDQNPEISQQLSLWKEGGSQVIRGNLLVVPVDSTLLYLEPLFLEAEQAAIPQLERVILASPRRVVMRPTLAGAVSALLASEPVAPTAERPEAARSAPGDDSRDQLLERARQLLDRAESQLRAGDWAGFGQSWRALRELLRGGGRAPAP